MSQTTALLDADLTPYFDDPTSESARDSSKPLQWLSDAAVTLVMVLLAPILVIPVAIAFAVACIRLQHFKLRYGDGGRYRSARERLAQPKSSEWQLRSSGYSAEPVYAGSRSAPARVSSYRWN
jgi:hypothetical protein